LKEDRDGDETLHQCGFAAAHSFCAALAAQSWKREQEWKNKTVGKMMAIPLILTKKIRILAGASLPS
jgi:hypothetical protein